MQRFREPCKRAPAGRAQPALAAGASTSPRCAAPTRRAPCSCSCACACAAPPLMASSSSFLKCGWRWPSGMILAASSLSKMPHIVPSWARWGWVRVGVWVRQARAGAWAGGPCGSRWRRRRLGSTTPHSLQSQPPSPAQHGGSPRYLLAGPHVLLVLPGRHGIPFHDGGRRGRGEAASGWARQARWEASRSRRARGRWRSSPRCAAPALAPPPGAPATPMPSPLTSSLPPPAAGR